MEYQYDFHNQRIDSFFELVGMGQPNMHLLIVSGGSVTKQKFRDYCAALRDDEQLTNEQESLAARIQSMGAAW